MLTLSQSRAVPAFSSQFVPIGHDGGNGTAKTVFGDQILKLPAYITPVYTCLLDLPDGKDGCFVEYVSGDRETLVGKRWLVGQSAYQYNPSGCLKVLDDKKGKIRFGLDLFLGALGCLNPHCDWNVSVALSIHDAQAFTFELTDSYRGRHVVKFNDGPAVTINIQVNTVVEEGVGAIIHYAASSGVDRIAGQSITLDLGHGTTICSVFDKTKLLFRETRRNGVADLIDAIARNIETRRQLSEEGDRTIIRAGIERGDFRYGHTDWNFRSVYETELRPWVTSTLAPAVRAVASWRPTSENFLAIGGGANLPGVSQLLEKHQINVLPDSLWANSRGLYKIAQIRASRGGI